MPERRIQDYRLAPVPHADETGWRTTGHHGDAWRFATPRLRLLLFRQTRAARVPPQVFGKPWLPGCVIVDRSGGDNQVPGASQYGSRHRRRAVQDLDKEFPDTAEVQAFVRTAAPQLALVMGRRTPLISDPEFARPAAALKAQLIATLEAPAPHVGLRRLQESFRAHGDRL
jgi:hypothetical protein